MSKQKNSSGHLKNPYERNENWLSPDWHFWENGNYTERAKERLRKFIASLKISLVQQQNFERRGFKI